MTLVLAVFAIHATRRPGLSQSSAPTNPPAASLPSTSDLVQRLKRYQQIEPILEGREDTRTYTESLAAALKAHLDEHPQDIAYFAYYLAHAMELLGKYDPANYDLAISYAIPIAKDLQNPNCAEARSLLTRNLNVDTIKNLHNPDPKILALRDSLQRDTEIYPCGRSADMKIDNWGPFRGLHSPRPSNLLVRDPGAVVHAADEYRGMKMWPQAIETYRLALGMMTELDWTTPEAAPLWKALGDCALQQGETEAALNDYYKCLASGMPLAEIGPSISLAKGRVSDKRQKAPDAPVPNADSLEKVSTLLASTQLFDHAIQAAELAATLRGGQSSSLPALHGQKAALLQKILDQTKEGVPVRGNIVTRDLIAAELRLSEKR